MLQKTMEKLNGITIITGVLGIVLGLLVGSFLFGGIKSQAKRIDSNGALLVGHSKSVVTNIKGKLAPPCKDRTGRALKKFGKCKAVVKNEEDVVLPILVDSETGEPLGDDKIKEIVVSWSYHGSHCAKHYFLFGGTEIDLC